MEKQSYKHFKNLTKFHFLYCMLFLISFTNCIIEIPIKKVKVEGIPKYKHIIIKEIDELFKNLNKTILIDDGSTILNSNTLFLGIVKVGSKGQQFNLVLDTGSSITWVAKAGSIDKHRISHHFDPSSSTTSINTGIKFEQKYGTGYCKGYYYRDYFSYIGKNIFNIKFGVADETEFGVDRGDGIIGLSHDYKDESTSFIHMLKKAKIIDSMAFSFKFDLDDDGVDEEYGKMYIGKHSDFSSNNTVTCPLITYEGRGNIFWGCEISGFGLRNSDYEVTSSRSYINIIFDTGTNALLLPLDYYNDIRNSLAQFGCTASSKDNYIFLICSTYFNEPPKITLNINGNTFIIPSNRAFSQSGSYYISNFHFVNANIYIIGSPFFLSFHTLFDKENEQLYFYPMKSAYLEIGSNIFAIILVIVIIILFVILFGCLIYRFIKWKKARDIENTFPSSDYNYI